MEFKLLPLPLFLERIKAGFPSPAEGYLDQNLDLNQYLIENPPATFFLKVEGDSMIEAGIHSNDILVVDRSLKPQSGKIVIASVDGELTVKRLYLSADKRTVELRPENANYKIIKLNESNELDIWGVVTAVVRKIRDK